MEMIEHIGGKPGYRNECTRDKIYTCPLRCGRTGKERNRKMFASDVHFHLDQKCPLMMVKCDFCKEEKAREDIKAGRGHGPKICLANMEKVYQKNVEQVEACDKEYEDLVKEYKELNLPTSELNNIINMLTSTSNVRSSGTGAGLFGNSPYNPPNWPGPSSIFG